MTFPVAQTIRELGALEVAAITGIPVRTIYRWAEKNSVAGKGVVQEFRLGLLKQAADKLRAAKPKKRGRAA